MSPARSSSARSQTGHTGSRAPFGPEWLAERLAALLPGFPDVDLCVALSGGVDSTALLAALAQALQLQQRSGAGPFRLRAVHIDHGIHPSSHHWSRHCRSLARRLGVPLKVFRTQVRPPRGASLEATARDARYQLLAQTLRPGEILLTAHQQDDQLETVLLQLFRGSGIAGLAAMPEVAPFAAGWHVRPLLSRARAELERWVQDQQLTWIEDETNTDERLDRNFLRRRVLPLIRERWPGAAGAVSRSARHAAQAQRILDAVARTDVERAGYGESLSVKALRTLPLERRRNALRYWIAASGRIVPDTRRLEEIATTVIDARADANPLVQWGDTVLRRSADLLMLHAASGASGPASQGKPATSGVAGPSDPAAFPATEVSVVSPIPQRHVSGSALTWSWRTSMSYPLPEGGTLELKPDPRGPLDLDALPPLLTIRSRRGGERLRPRRGGPRRALKTLLQEARVSVVDRARLPLIFAGEALVAVADLWLDESVQASPTVAHRARVLWTRSAP